MMIDSQIGKFSIARRTLTRFNEFAVDELRSHEYYLRFADQTVPILFASRSSSPVQDIALSRRQHGFKSRTGRHSNPIIVQLHHQSFPNTPVIMVHSPPRRS
jgi:hypothetical protein